MAWTKPAAYESIRSLSTPMLLGTPFNHPAMSNSKLTLKAASGSFPKFFGYPKCIHTSSYNLWNIIFFPVTKWFCIITKGGKTVLLSTLQATFWNSSCIHCDLFPQTFHLHPTQLFTTKSQVRNAKTSWRWYCHGPTPNNSLPPLDVDHLKDMTVENPTKCRFLRWFFYTVWRVHTMFISESCKKDSML